MLPSKEAPKRVLDYNKNMKFIIMLREPVSRAYSAYNYAIKNDWENIQNSFLETIDLEKKRIEKRQYDLMYFENGKYYKHIKYWQTYFPKENILIIKDSDLRNNSQETINRIFNFLKIERFEVDTKKEFNKAGEVRYKWLQSWLLNKNIFKSFFGMFITSNVKVWIRSNFFKRAYAFNQIDQLNTPLDVKTKNRIHKIFHKDLEQLKNKLGISFNKN